MASNEFLIEKLGELFCLGWLDPPRSHFAFSVDEGQGLEGQTEVSLLTSQERERMNEPRKSHQLKNRHATQCVNGRLFVELACH